MNLLHKCAEILMEKEKKIEINQSDNGNSSYKYGI